MYNFRFNNKFGLIIVNILPQSNLTLFYRLLDCQPHSPSLQNGVHTMMLHVLHEDSHEDDVVDKLPMGLKITAFLVIFSNPLRASGSSSSLICSGPCHQKA